MNDTDKQIYQQGYTDAYYGKDKSENYSELDAMIYKAGKEEFYKEFNEVDVMKELNG